MLPIKLFATGQSHLPGDVSHAVSSGILSKILFHTGIFMLELLMLVAVRTSNSTTLLNDYFTIWLLAKYYRVHQMQTP